MKWNESAYDVMQLQCHLSYVSSAELALPYSYQNRYVTQSKEWEREAETEDTRKQETDWAFKKKKRWNEKKNPPIPSNVFARANTAHVVAMKWNTNQCKADCKVSISKSKINSVSGNSSKLINRFEIVCFWLTILKLAYVCRWTIHVMLELKLFALLQNSNESQ